MNLVLPPSLSGPAGGIPACTLDLPGNTVRDFTNGCPVDSLLVPRVLFRTDRRGPWVVVKGKDGLWCGWRAGRGW